VNPKKKKKIGHWGWPQSTPTVRGKEIRRPLVAIFVSLANKKKKDPATQTQPKKIIYNATKIVFNATKLVYNALKLKPSFAKKKKKTKT
jgi:hypothetical protein